VDNFVFSTTSSDTGEEIAERVKIIVFFYEPHGLILGEEKCFSSGPIIVDRVGLCYSCLKRQTRTNVHLFIPVCLGQCIVCRFGFLKD
jgi:hypothetical protein